MKAKIKLRAINRLRKDQDYFDRLAKPGEGRTERTFSTIKDMMIFCAFLGYDQNQRVPLPAEEPKEDIQEHIFTNDEMALHSIFILGLAASGDWQILHPDKSEELVKIFEEYANGGMGIVKEWLDRDLHDLSGIKVILSGLRTFECLPTRQVLGQAPTKAGSIEF